MNKRKITSASAVAKLLRKRGVEAVFASPAETIRLMLQAIDAAGIRVIGTQHPQGAGHAADGYARASGRCGVCIVAGGAGVSSAVTPLATACSDSVPVLAIAGHVAQSDCDACGQIDAVGVTRSCTKWNTVVTRPEELGQAIEESLLIATHGRPGPVLIDVPVDVQQARCKREMRGGVRDWIAAKYGPATTQASEESLNEAAELLDAAQCPVIYAGHGVVLGGAADALRELATKAAIPVTTTLLGLGGFDELSPLSLCMLGMHGSAAANYAVQECDCLLAVGARFDDRVTSDPVRFAPHARIIQIDIDPTNVGKILEPDVALVGDAGEVLRALAQRIEAKQRPQWLSRIAGWKKRYGFRFADDTNHPKPQSIIREIERRTGSEAVFVTGVGQHQMWTAQFIRWRRPRQFVTSGGLGTMGFGLPAAIGAAAACPDRPVIDIDGDGSFLMTSFELPTLARHKLPVKVAILSNRFLGMVKQWQDLFYHGRHSQSGLKNPDFAGMAEACGVMGLRCGRKEDVGDTVETMLAHDGPVVADFRVDSDEHVYPIVGPGKGLHEMHLGTLEWKDF